MMTARSFILLLVVLGVAQIVSGQTHSSAEEIKTAAKEFADLLAKQDFTAAVERFGSRLKAVMTADVLRDTWKGIVKEIGAFERQLGVRLEGPPGRRTAFVTCQFEMAFMDLEVRFNDRKEILTFHLSTRTGDIKPAAANDSSIARSAGLPKSDRAPRVDRSKTDLQEALLDLLKVREAWKITRGSEKVLVGVIDGGFDFYHPALKGKIIPGCYYSGGYHSQFYVNMAHGTMMASIIVAQKKGDEGMTGLAPDCKVLTASQGMIEHAMLRLQSDWVKEHPNATPAEAGKARMSVMREHRNELVKFGEDWVRYQISGAAEAIRYLVDNGARVINFSGYLTRSACPEADLWKDLEDAFAYAAKENVIIVLGAGNGGRQTEDYPGKADTMIIAGASNLDDTRWVTELKIPGMPRPIKQGSDFGKRLTVMAPTEKMGVCAPHAERFYSCDDGPVGESKARFKGMYDTRPNGATSSAAPIVSSLAALVLSVRPDLGAEDVVEIIKAGCDDIGEKGYDIYTGHGRVNFAKTLKLAANWNRKETNPD